MEENKYYIPDINEFHVGFEYEWKRIDSDHWDYGIIKEGAQIDDINVFVYDLRVKYLDRKDIESLGWSWNEKYNHFELKDYRLSGQIQYQNITIERHCEDYPMGEHQQWDEILFNGKIKNKSEFIKVMQMCQIIKI